MAGWRDIGNIWTTFREIDVRPIRDEAEEAILIAFVGAEGVGKTTLVTAMRSNARSDEMIITPAIELDIRAMTGVDADLVVLVLDVTRSDTSTELTLYRQLTKDGKNVLVFFNKMDLVPNHTTAAAMTAAWSSARSAFGSAVNCDSLVNEFVPRVLDALPQKHLALARHYPVFRTAVANRLIGDTAFANATYSLGTGLAEIIPVLDIPFNVADMVVLTKNQALLVYKLGLALGLSARWQDHVGQLGGVVGAGFLWRQVARQLVGLIPVWGIVPKVAVAYGGTYAVGEAVLYWYRTGNKMPSSAMQQVYARAVERGRNVARMLVERARHQRRVASLPIRAKASIICSNCGRHNPPDASFCAFCGKPIEKVAEPRTVQEQQDPIT